MAKGRSTNTSGWPTRCNGHGFPAGVVTVACGSPQCIEALETADVVISSTHIELEWEKARGSVYLQTRSTCRPGTGRP